MGQRDYGSEKEKKKDFHRFSKAQTKHFTKYQNYFDFKFKFYWGCFLFSLNCCVSTSHLRNDQEVSKKRQQIRYSVWSLSYRKQNTTI